MSLWSSLDWNMLMFNSKSISSTAVSSHSISQSHLLRFLHGMGPVFILVAHIGCLLLFRERLGLYAILWATVLYLVRMLGITAIYHRLITHNSYKAPRLVWWIGSIITASAGQMGPSWWKAHHKAHHRHVDTLDDPHSPLMYRNRLHGFWHSQIGWILSPGFHPSTLPADIESDPVLRLIDRLHIVPALALAWISWHIGGIEWLGAFCLSTTLLFHGVATVNSVAHLVGDQPFITRDGSRNNPWVAIITLGEGWHNLHHSFEYSARQGFTLQGNKVVTLPDPTYYFIRFLERLGWAYQLRIPSKQALLAKANH
jgi:stearoyl-CoA desaturase (delta-9 desaturase)